MTACVLLLGAFPDYLRDFSGTRLHGVSLTLSRTKSKGLDYLSGAVHGSLLRHERRGTSNNPNCSKFETGKSVDVSS